MIPEHGRTVRKVSGRSEDRQRMAAETGPIICSGRAGDRSARQHRGVSYEFPFSCSGQEASPSPPSAEELVWQEARLQGLDLRGRKWRAGPREAPPAPVGRRADGRYDEHGRRPVLILDGPTTGLDQPQQLRALPVLRTCGSGQIALTAT